MRSAKSSAKPAKKRLARKPNQPASASPAPSPVVVKGTVVEFGGNRYVAVYHDRRGWYYQPARKDGVTPNRRMALACFDFGTLKIVHQPEAK